LLAPSPPKYATADAPNAENFRPRRRESAAADEFDLQPFMLVRVVKTPKLAECCFGSLRQFHKTLGGDELKIVKNLRNYYKDFHVGH